MAASFLVFIIFSSVASQLIRLSCLIISTSGIPGCCLVLKFLWYNITREHDVTISSSSASSLKIIPLVHWCWDTHLSLCFIYIYETLSRAYTFLIFWYLVFSLLYLLEGESWEGNLLFSTLSLRLPIPSFSTWPCAPRWSRLNTFLIHQQNWLCCLYWLNTSCTQIKKAKIMYGKPVTDMSSMANNLLVLHSLLVKVISIFIFDSDYYTLC